MTQEEIVGAIAAIIAPIVGTYLANLSARRLWNEMQARGLDERLADLIVEYDFYSTQEMEG